MEALVNEIDAVQLDMICMEGMLSALAAGAYNGERAEHIGNSLEILREYLGQRSEQLDQIAGRLRVMQAEGAAALGKSLSDRCSRQDRFSADAGRPAPQSWEEGADGKGHV